MVTVRRALSVLAGFLVAALALAVLVRVVGTADVAAALRSADRVWVGVALLAAICWMVAWSQTLYLVLAVIGIPRSRRASLLVYLGVLFANNVAPFSVGGGEPIAAFLVSRSTRTNYETSLLAVVSVDVLNYLPAPLLAVVSLLYVASTVALGRRIEVVVGTLLALSASLVVVGVVGWRYRHRVAVTAVRTLVAAQRVTARVLPFAVPSVDGLQSRVEAFVVGLERVAADRRVLSVGFASSTLGWLCQALVLWAALRAVGAVVPVELPVLVVTLVTVSDVVPLPAGLGAVDATTVVLLVTVAGVPAAAATAATLVFRSATLLFSILLGGTTSLALQLTSSG
ncbi:MAG: YbhN family protein [Haloplanus sp.]